MGYCDLAFWRRSATGDRFPPELLDQGRAFGVDLAEFASHIRMEVVRAVEGLGGLREPLHLVGQGLRAAPRQSSSSASMSEMYDFAT